MNLSKYPRPKGDTGIGFRLPADQYDRLGPDHWLQLLKAAGASWAILPIYHPRSVPAALLMDLSSKDIETVVQVIVSPVAPIEPNLLRNIMARYRDCGVHYISFYDRPNSVYQWKLEDWRKPQLLQRFVDMFLPCIEPASEIGLFPLLSPLEPGGEYWDTGFLAGVLQELKERDRLPLFDRLAVGIYNYAYNRPLSWGKGGRGRWKEALPYQTPPGSEDHIGFHLFEWYNEHIREKLGFSLPLISMGSGAGPTEWEDATFSPLEGKTAAQRNQEAVSLLMEGELSDCLFNLAFPLEPVMEDATVATIKSLRELPRHPRHFSWNKPEKALKSTFPKPIYHYLLLPDTEGPKAWPEKYVRRFRPTCGFRLDEAMQAEFVTILGDNLGISPQEERKVRAAGCKVERVSGKNVREARKLLDEMAEDGKRFLTIG